MKSIRYKAENAQRAGVVITQNEDKITLSWPAGYEGLSRFLIVGGVSLLVLGFGLIYYGMTQNVPIGLMIGSVLVLLAIFMLFRGYQLSQLKMQLDIKPDGISLASSMGKGAFGLESREIDPRNYNAITIVQPEAEAVRQGVLGVSKNPAILVHRKDRDAWDLLVQAGLKDMDRSGFIIRMIRQIHEIPTFKPGKDKEKLEILAASGEFEKEKPKPEETKKEEE